MKNLLLLLLFSLFGLTLHAQLEGKVLDAESSPLPYVNVYVAGTSIGTTTNDDGYYRLDLQNGTHQISYQYIGYKTITEEVNISNGKITYTDIKLESEEYALEEITISANAEDPAYAIIRKAQAARESNNNQLNNKICNAYVRGFNKIVESPDKIMGIDIGDLEGTLDPDGSGIVYLSESVSKLYQKDKQIKEVMTSSKVSGDDQGYSFNSAREMDFNFYDNTLNLNRDLVTPIASNAMAHYRYKLEGAHYQGTQLVNKIKVIPKNEFGNSFYGYIYINENLWNINSIDLSVTKHSTQLPFIDNLTFKQVFADIGDNRWAPLSNIINFNMSALGFKVEGNFACVYSNYELGQLSDDFFNNEVYEVLEGSNEHSSEYWDTLRPIPLSHEQSLDYHRKDSIRILKESPEYIDSIDKASNKFGLKKILMGYSHQDSKKQSSWGISSPLASISLNTIQGWNTAIKFESTKYYDSQKTKELKTELSVNYGLSEKTWRPTFKLNYLANKTNNAHLKIEGGKSLNQYNRQQPIGKLMNSVYSIFFRHNYLKAYDKAYGAIGYGQQLGPGLSGNISLNYEDRTAVVNNYNGGLKQDVRNYTSNNPLNALDSDPAFESHQALLLRAFLIINIGQKIWKYPNRIYRENSSWPTLGIFYKGAIKTLGADTDYHILYSTLVKEINFNIYGNSDIYLLGGQFMGNKPEYFVDYFHFIGTQTHLAYAGEYSRRFLMLPYYEKSSGEGFFQAHFQHHFQGFLLSKIPLIKRTGFSLVAGYKILASTDNSTYDEIHLGIDNIGIKLSRIFRVDLVWHKDHCNGCDDSRQLSAVVGLKINL